jgi:hypothetical protein
MSTGAIFRLISNDGRQDKLLQATQLLHNRLIQISAMREKMGQDPTPTLADIERTHILFVNAHFKPFVAIAYEYNKVTAPGTHTLGQKVEFNIPQFGDFFSDMVLNVKLTMSSATYHGWTGTNTLTGVEIGSWTDLATNNPSQKFRWCDYPGERVLQLVEFTVNGNPLDSYTPFSANVWREFYIQPNKRRGWDRCVGQQIKEDAVINPKNIYTGLNEVDNTSTPLLDTMQFTSNNCELWVKTSNGLQTPAYGHEKVVNLWIPLLFWFNTDFRLSVPSVAIPYGQRYITTTLANANKLIGYPIMFQGGLAHDSAPCVTGYSIVTPDFYIAGSMTNSKLDVELTLYINNLFVNPEIHEIFIRRISFNLIRVHKLQEFNITKSNDSLLLNSLKWPIETLYIGMRSVDVDSTDEKVHMINLEQWHTFTRNHYCECIQPIITYSDQTTVNIAENTLNDGDGIIGLEVDGDDDGITGQVAIQAIKIDKQPILNTLSISAHGIKFYDNFSADFFNKYMPYRYGGPNVMTPEDKGLLMVNFALYPNSYQPSGHLNVSRAREFYLDYNTTTTVSTEINAGTASANGRKYRLLVLASAINFLLISDGSAVLRYST